MSHVPHTPRGVAGGGGSVNGRRICRRFRQDDVGQTVGGGTRG